MEPASLEFDSEMASPGYIDIPPVDKDSETPSGLDFEDVPNKVSYRNYAALSYGRRYCIQRDNIQYRAVQQAVPGPDAAPSLQGITNEIIFHGIRELKSKAIF